MQRTYCHSRPTSCLVGSSCQLGTSRIICCLMWCCCLSGNLAQAEDKPAVPKLIKHQITGLFSPDREQDLRDALATLPQFRLVDIDYKNAEVTLEYDPAKLWPGVKPEKYLELFDNELRKASGHTFRARPLRTVPLDKLKRIEIPIEGLDCKGCSYAAYLRIYELPGVEVATASFKAGKVTAFVDPEKIDQVKLEEALKQGGVEIKRPTK
jgi:copper chaperone CopZ